MGCGFGRQEGKKNTETGKKKKNMKKKKKDNAITHLLDQPWPSWVLQALKQPLLIEQWGKSFRDINGGQRRVAVYRERERESTVQERVMQMQMQMQTGWLSIVDKKKIDRNSRLWRGGGPVWCRLVSAFLFFFVLSTPIYFSFLHHLCLCPLKQKK